MKTLYAVCVAAILVLAVITISLRSESTAFYGIADAQEIVINDEFALEIKKIHVVPGQRVRAGDTLLEVKRPDLDLKIAEIGRQLGEITTQKSAHVSLSRYEVLQHKAQQSARVAEFRAQIKQLELQYEMNRSLVAELRSVKKVEAAGGEADSDTANPIAIKIQQLKRALDLALDSSKIGIHRLNNELSYEGDPLAERVKGLQNEMNLLLTERIQSFKIARMDGLIGAVNFKEGDKLSPFTSIMTLHAEAPSYVRGYIHENAYSAVRLGEKVTVSSLADKNVTIAGEVVGIGSRIVEYPIRLRKSPELQMWGREITVKIPEKNAFLLGEKVLITLLNATKAAAAPPNSGKCGSRGLMYAYSKQTPPDPSFRISTKRVER